MSNLEELDKTAIDVFLKKARNGNRIDAEALNESDKTLFEKLYLLEEGKLKRAAALLFHPDPERFITGAYVKIGYFRSETELVYQDEIHGPLILQIDKTLEVLTTKYLRDMISYEGIQRVEKYPYPESALREAVTNAISHKNYSGATPIQIKVFEDKISIWNDAVLPANWTVDVLKRPHPSKPYNPDIANTMFRAGMAEAWGRGTIDIINHCIDYGIREPEFVFDVTGFSVIFYSGSSEKTSEKSSEKILRLLSENNKMTIAGLSSRLSDFPPQGIPLIL